MKYIYLGICKVGEKSHKTPGSLRFLEVKNMKKMSTSVKSVVVLVAICSIVAVLLALTNSITAPIIEENENKKANAALLEVLPDGESFLHEIL